MADYSKPKAATKSVATKSLTDTCLEVHESTAVRLKENIPPYPKGTMFVYRCERWYYPEYDLAVDNWDGVGASQLWYVGATREEIPRWMYALLLRADLYKGSDHRLKELFEISFKNGTKGNDLASERSGDDDDVSNPQYQPNDPVGNLEGRDGG